VLRAGAMGGRGMGTFFLYLNEDTWIGEAGERLASEVRIARRANVPIVLVHENDPDAGACEFGKFFSTTPGDLIQSGLYSALALAFYPGPARHTSCCLIARTLNAKKISRVENLKQSVRVIAAPAIRASAAISRRSSVGMAVMASSVKDGARRAPVTLHHAESAEASESTAKKSRVSGRRPSSRKGSSAVQGGKIDLSTVPEWESDRSPGRSRGTSASPATQPEGEVDLGEVSAPVAPAEMISHV